MTREKQCAPHIQSVKGGWGRGRKGLRRPTDVTTPTEWTPAAHVMSAGWTEQRPFDWSPVTAPSWHTRKRWSRHPPQPWVLCLCHLHGNNPQPFLRQRDEWCSTKEPIVPLQTTFQPSHKLQTTSLHMWVEYVCYTTYTQV